MPQSCCIKSCKSVRCKTSNITFHRFPITNKKIIKYWIAATGQNMNWIPYSGAQICNLHFVNNDYYNDVKRYLKRNVIPTQHVHSNLLKLLQQEPLNKIKEYILNNDIIMEDLSKQQLSEETNDDKNEESNDKNEESNNNNEESNDNNEKSNDKNEETAIMKYFNCSNYNNLAENEQLRKEIKNLKEQLDTRLNQQAKMFRTLIDNNEAVFKKKLKSLANTNVNLKIYI